jgi:hypothetical protein
MMEIFSWKNWQCQFMAGKIRFLANLRHPRLAVREPQFAINSTGAPAIKEDANIPILARTAPSQVMQSATVGVRSRPPVCSSRPHCPVLQKCKVNSTVVVVKTQENSNWCPLVAVGDCLAVAGTSEVLFSHFDSLVEFCDFAGQQLFQSHSFRIGAATTAKQMGMSD